MAERRGRVLRPPRWGVPDGVITIVGALLTSIVVAVGLTGANLGLATVLLLGTVTPWFFLIGWPLYATRSRGNGALDLGWRFTPADLGWGLLGGVVALLASVLAALVTSLFVPDLESAAGQVAEEIADSGAAWQLYLFALVALIGAPIAEEIAFRGMLWAGLRKAGWGAWATGVTVTLVFAVFHFEPTRLLILLAIGAVLAVLRSRTRALGAPIVAHAINNTPGALAILALTQ
ncbi:MAG: CPBP family intramembrane metalloprotease [Actinobacteria bacterium]|nr:CPBP family intramembrane metalloprotease [Actinomycetota bacterium]